MRDKALPASDLTWLPDCYPPAGSAFSRRPQDLVSGLRNYFREAGGVKDFLLEKIGLESRLFFNKLYDSLQAISGSGRG
jgi:hypothetical protein